MITQEISKTKRPFWKKEKNIIFRISYSEKLLQENELLCHQLFHDEGGLFAVHLDAVMMS